MKLEIIAGRILISAKCRMKGCAARCSEPTTQSKRLLARDRFCCDHLMDPLRRAKNVGFTISSDIKSFFGTSIRTIGNDPGRPQYVIAFSKKRSPAQLCCPTTFTRGRLKRCRQLSMHYRRKVLAS